MFVRWFLEHPHSVGESYGRHLRAALGFSALLFLAATVCLIHALVPALFERRASRIVTELNDRMRRRSPTPVPSDQPILSVLIRRHS
jgi:hypothetical protein